MTAPERLPARGKIVSLYDMNRHEGAWALQLAGYLERTQCIAENYTNQLDRLSDEDRKAMEDNLDKMAHDCAALGLSAAPKSVFVTRQALTSCNHSQLVAHLHMIKNVIAIDLKELVFFRLTGEEATFYEVGEPLGPDAAKAFPEAIIDATEAGYCYALGRYTAAVYHAMMVLEHALKAMARHVGAINKDDQWKNVIDEIEVSIERIQNNGIQGKNKAVKNEVLQKLSEAAKEFSYFKDGWRNYVTHGKARYDGPQAFSILSHVRAFAIKLAPQLSEPLVL